MTDNPLSPDDAEESHRRQATKGGAVGCEHHEDGRLRPCPDLCQVQCWPRRLFRTSLFAGRWVLRRRYRPYRAAWAAYHREFRAYAAQFPRGRYRGAVAPNPPPDVPAVPN